MAPSIAENTTQPAVSLKGPTDYKEAASVASGPKGYDMDKELNGTGERAGARYPKYLPTWDFSQTYDALENFDYVEHGKGADPTFPDLLKGGQEELITGNIGAQIRGVQISQLSQKGKDQLALYVAKKKVVAFPDQDFADIPIEQALEFGRYFGPLHIHPTSPAPAGHPEVHVVFRGTDDHNSKNYFEDRISSVAWHTDVSYEKQPPGVTFLYMLDGPPQGGDTLFSNNVEAYNRLSPEFKKRLHGLKAYHTAGEQAAMSQSRGGLLRREAVTSVHPVVRTHPATGEKALYVNPQFTRRIVGYKKEESDMLLKFLFDHIAFGADFHARVKWAPRTVVAWDNRVASHTAIVDWMSGERRHIARITPQAEAPYETPFEEE